jgi:hypothetical protein
LDDLHEKINRMDREVGLLKHSNIPQEERNYAKPEDRNYAKPEEVR